MACSGTGKKVHRFIALSSHSYDASEVWSASTNNRNTEYDNIDYSLTHLPIADVKTALLMRTGEQTLTGPLMDLLSIIKSIASNVSLRLTQLNGCFPLPSTPPAPNPNIGISFDRMPAFVVNIGAKRTHTVRTPSASALNASLSQSRAILVRKPIHE